LSWPQLLERFARLSPAERLRLLEKVSGGEVATQKVARDTLTLEIIARGSLEAARASDVVCLVKAHPNKPGFTPTVKWVIDEGSPVKKGDKVVAIDDSALQQELKERTLDLEKARAAYAKSQENLKRVQAENEIDVRLMEIALRLAELAQQSDKGQGRTATEALRLKMEQARLGLERSRVQARAKEAEAQSDVRAKAAAVAFEESRQREIEAQLAQCVLRAPRDGIVLYYVPEPTRLGSRTSSIVAPGEPVREGQKLLQIPDLSQMQVHVRVPEALVAHLRNEIIADARGPQAARIQVDAFPERPLAGHVQTVDTVASHQDWFASDVKVFKTIVAIDTPVAGLKPGMSAEIRIKAQFTPGPVLQVPAASVLAVGKQRLCFLVTDKDIQEREVLTGVSSDQVIEIRSGLKQGDRILSAPRTLLRRVAPLLNQGRGPAAGPEALRRPMPGALVVRSIQPREERNPQRAWVAAYGLTYRDLDRIAALPAVAQAVPVRSFPHEARRLARVVNAQVIATTPEYADVQGLALAEGRFLSASDNRFLRNVAVLAPAVADQLFGGQEPLGATVVVGSSPFVVVGVLRERDAAPDGQAAASPSPGGIYIPLRTCQARFGERIILRRGGRRIGEAVALHAILVTVRDRQDQFGAAEDIRELLEETHPTMDWAVETPPGS
jgi:RND family efflux transporter MFP subunit